MQKQNTCAHYLNFRRNIFLKEKWDIFNVRYDVIIYGLEFNEKKNI